MPNPTPLEPTSPHGPRTYSFGAALLSYLVPGLGQISQGRFAKGLVFMMALYTLFFYGMYLGNWSNVYLPDTADRNNKTWNWPKLVSNVYNRLQFAGQFWIGVAAWPALWHYNQMPVPSAETSPFWHNLQRTPPEQLSKERLSDLRERENRESLGSQEKVLLDWGKWKAEGLNEMQANGDKTWDLGWVFTVIAGVLNILVIYDAYAGPAMGTESEPRVRPQEAAA